MTKIIAKTIGAYIIIEFILFMLSSLCSGSGYYENWSDIVCFLFVFLSCISLFVVSIVAAAAIKSGGYGK